MNRALPLIFVILIGTIVLFLIIRPTLNQEVTEPNATAKDSLKIGEAVYWSKKNRFFKISNEQWEFSDDPYSIPFKKVVTLEAYAELNKHYGFNLIPDETKIPKKKSIERKRSDLDARIKEIKSWYAEIQSLSLSNCLNKSLIIYDGLTPENVFPFEQNLKLCELSNGFEVTQAKLPGYESGCQVNIYKKNGKIFFVFIQGGVEAWYFEKRFYCDENECVIRHLEKEYTDSEIENSENKLIILPDVKPKIQQLAASYFKQVDEIMSKGKDGRK